MNKLNQEVKDILDHHGLWKLFPHGNQNELADDIYEWCCIVADIIRQNTIKEIEQYKCQSYYDDEGILQDCTCGKCDPTTGAANTKDASTTTESTTTEEKL